MLSMLLASLCLAAAPVTFDAERHSVTFTATSTDCGLDMQLEFLFVGPNSDRDYESMFVTDASVKEIADAFDKAGIPRGRSIDHAASRFWPAGNVLEMKPSFSELVREMRGEKVPPVIYTGGLRDKSGFPQAETNMPAAVFALYGCGQSLVHLDDSLDQSVTYGRFQPAVKIPKGERREFTFTWDGKKFWEPHALKLERGNVAEAITALKEHASRCEVDVTADFSDDLTVAEAAGFAQAIAMVDSSRVKINGFPEGQLFYRAYLPMEKWRDRRERLSQPPEVHLRADGSYVVVNIKEDWSDEASLDPRLTPEESVFADCAAAAAKASSLAARTSTILLFAPADMKLSRIFEFRRGVKGAVSTWYVFQE